MRRIDADEVLARIAPIIKGAETRNRERFNTARRCAEIVSRAPTVCEEIVRCGQCAEHWKNGGICITDPEWFCADGRKR